MKREACLQGILHISHKPHLPGFPVKEPSLKVPFMESLTERCPTTRALLHSWIKVPSIRAPPTYQVPLRWKGAPMERDAFPNVSSRVPSEGAPPEATSMEPLQREMLHPQSPLHPALKGPSRRAILQVPQNGAPLERAARLQSLFYISFRVPSKERSLQVPFTELLQRVTLHLQSPFQPYLKVPGRWAHSRLPNWAPMKRDAHPQSLPFITFRALSKGAPPPPGSPNRAPIEKDAPFPEPPFNYLSELPVNGPSLILNRAPVEKGAHLQGLHKALVDKPPLNSPAGPPWRMTSIPWALLHVSGSPERKPP